MLQNPQMVLTFYPFGIVRKVTTVNGTKESLINPDHLKQVLADQEVEWSTGIIQPDLLHLSQKGARALTVSFRSAQKTGIWLDGVAEPLRLPMPPMVLFKIAKQGKPVSYRLYAVERRPRTGKEQLYVPPLPNTYANGSICWGSVARPQSTLGNTDMTEDWNMLLGSGFNHGTGHKSKKYPNDIRTMLRHVQDEGMGRYPLDDLIAANKPSTFNEALEELRS